MPEFHVRVCLEASDAEPACVEGTLIEFTLAQRVKRASIVFGTAVVLSATLIPVPLVHLIGIPLLLVTGSVLAAMQLGAAVRLQPMRIPCPKCGTVNRIGSASGRQHLDGAIERMCESCRRPLTMRVTRL